MQYPVLGMIGFQELLPILIIVLVLFGAKKLPELARAMGSSINQFKKGLSEAEDAEDPPQLSEGERRDGDSSRAPRPAAGEGTAADKEKSRVP